MPELPIFQPSSLVRLACDNDALRLQVLALTTEKRRLEGLLDTVTTDKTKLTADIKELKAQTNSLLEETKRLKAEVNWLTKEVEDLRKQLAVSCLARSRIDRLSSTQLGFAGARNHDRRTHGHGRQARNLDRCELFGDIT
jgi:seryl-tRNA synthetase